MEIPSPALPVDNHQPPLANMIGHSPWRDVFLAGIPHLWLGIAVAFGKLAGDHETLVPNLSLAFLFLFLISSVLVVAYAWRNRWPLWTAAWYSYTFWLLVIGLAYLISLPSAYLLGAANWIANAILLLGSMAAIGLAYLFLFRHSRLHALLVGLFLLPVASQLGLEAIPDAWEAFIALFFGLLAAFVSAYSVWSLSWAKGVTTALFANLCAGAALTYISFFQVEIPGFYGEGILAIFLSFAGYLAVALALFLGPWIFWAGWDFVKEKLR